MKMLTLVIYVDRVLGMFDYPQEVTDIIILGCGRYEYKKILNLK